MTTPNITTQDILNRVNDYLSNYTTGSIDLGNRLRAINGAIEYVKRRMTLPSDEMVQTFYFYDDNLYYDLNLDFNEGLFVFYDDKNKNFPNNAWNYAPYGDILRMSGRQFGNQNWFSWTPINGKMQLMMFGRNLNQGTQLETFDNLGSIVAQNNAQNARIDNNIYAEGSGSLAFDINPAASILKIASIYLPTNYDFTQMLLNSGVFKMNVFLPLANITSINLVLMTDSLNYYVLSATTFDDGSAFSTGLNDITKKVKFGFSNDVVVGSPAIGKITAIRFDFVMSGSFGSSIIEDYRIDNLYTVFPDKMDLVYLTSYKGTDSTGATQKIFLTDASDIPSFGNFVPDLIDVIAYRAALILVPQLISNADFRKMYLDEQEHLMNVFGKSWPRKRTLNMSRLIISRPR